MFTLPKCLEMLGGLLIAIGAIWWFTFFHDKDTAHFLVCAIWTTTQCGILNAAAEFAGGMGYYPFLMWLGLACWALRMVLTDTEAGDVNISKDDP